MRYVGTDAEGLGHTGTKGPVWEGSTTKFVEERFDAGWRRLTVWHKDHLGERVVGWIDRIDGKRVWSAEDDTPES
jgi:hypothetical protein